MSEQVLIGQDVTSSEPRPDRAADRAPSARAGDARSVRRNVWGYVALTLVVSFAFEAWMLRSAGGLAALGGYSAWLLMWIPGVLSLVWRLVRREGFRDIGLGLGKLSAWGWAHLIPVLCALFAYALSFAFGIVHFLPGTEGHKPLGQWIISTIVIAFVGLPLSAGTALGEELGWRGYMVTRLVRGGVRFPLVTSGIIWGVWHLPLIVFGDYNASGHPWLSAAMFMVAVTFGGVIFGWLRLAGRSVWPAVLAHAVHNLYFQAIFDKAFDGDNEIYFATEAGVFPCIFYAAIAAWLWRSGALARATRRERT